MTLADLRWDFAADPAGNLEGPRLIHRTYLVRIVNAPIPPLMGRDRPRSGRGGEAGAGVLRLGMVARIRTRWMIPVSPPVSASPRHPPHDGRERIRRPVSRVLCRPARAGRGGHSSGPAVTGRFSRPTRIPRSGDAPTRQFPKDLAGAGSLFGLAPGGACHAAPVTSGPVRSYRTLSPLPSFAGGFGGQALRSLGGAGRSALCGAIPGVTPGGRYPPPCRRGARTFLDPRRGRDRPAV